MILPVCHCNWKVDGRKLGTNTDKGRTLPGLLCSMAGSPLPFQDPWEYICSEHWTDWIRFWSQMLGRSPESCRCKFFFQSTLSRPSNKDQELRKGRSEWMLEESIAPNHKRSQWQNQLCKQGNTVELFVSYTIQIGLELIFLIFMKLPRSKLHQWPPKSFLLLKDNPCRKISVDRYHLQVCRLRPFNWKHSTFWNILCRLLRNDDSALINSHWHSC